MRYPTLSFPCPKGKGRLCQCKLQLSLFKYLTVDTTETLPKEVILTQRSVQLATPSSEQLHSLCMPEDMQRLKNSLATERSKSNPLLRFTEKKLLERQKSLWLVWQKWEHQRHPMWSEVVLHHSNTREFPWGGWQGILLASGFEI